MAAYQAGRFCRHKQLYTEIGRTEHDANLQTDSQSHEFRGCSYTVLTNKHTVRCGNAVDIVRTFTTGVEVYSKI